jgi:hypothetical protein
VLLSVKEMTIDMLVWSIMENAFAVLQLTVLKLPSQTATFLAQETAAKCVEETTSYPSTKTPPSLPWMIPPFQTTSPWDATLREPMAAL